MDEGPLLNRHHLRCERYKDKDVVLGPKKFTASPKTDIKINMVVPGARSRKSGLVGGSGNTEEGMTTCEAGGEGGGLPRRGDSQDESGRTSRRPPGWAGGEGRGILGERGPQGMRPEGTHGRCQSAGAAAVGCMAVRGRK